MNRIDRKSFFSLIKGKDLFSEESGTIVPSIYDDVVESKLKSKFIYSISKNISALDAQNSLCNNFLNKIPLNNAAVAYRSGSSYLNLFEPHLNSYYFLRIDISSFFHSINSLMISEVFKKYFEKEFLSEDNNQSVLDGFVSLVTYNVPKSSLNKRFAGKSILPIGFKTSPVLSNIVFRELDLLIQKFCASKKIAFTRYADDMLFSSDSGSKFIHSDSFLNEIRVLLSLKGFKINKNKTLMAEHTLSLNGYTISKNKFNNKCFLKASNKKTKIIDKIIYMMNKEIPEDEIIRKISGNQSFNFKYVPPSKEYYVKYCRHQLLNKLTGYRSFLISFIRFDEKYSCIDPLAINKYTDLIGKLNKSINDIEKKLS